MKTQHEWTEEILGSVDGMQRAKLPEGLQQRIVGAVKFRKRASQQLPSKAVWAMAAGLALLVGANIFSLVQHNNVVKNIHEVASGNQASTNEYFSAVTNY